MLRGTGRDHGYAGVRRAPEHVTPVQNPPPPPPSAPMRASPPPPAVPPRASHTPAVNYQAAMLAINAYLCCMDYRELHKASPVAKGLLPQHKGGNTFCLHHYVACRRIRQWYQRCVRPPPRRAPCKEQGR